MLHATLALVAAAATAARSDPTEILSIHGLAHSGTTIVGIPERDVRRITALNSGAFATLAKPRDAAAVLKICFAGK